MPFAGEFRSGMRFPDEGASVGRFIIESIRVEHVGAGAGRYEYPIELVVSGKGGKDGARKALKPLLSSRATIFSGYGNPYQCSIGTVQVESLGPERYRVTARGVGVRVHLRHELARFLGWLVEARNVSDLSGAAVEARDKVVADYLDKYWSESDASRRNPSA